VRRHGVVPPIDADARTDGTQDLAESEAVS